MKLYTAGAMPGESILRRIKNPPASDIISEPITLPQLKAPPAIWRCYAAGS